MQGRWQPWQRAGVAARAGGVGRGVNKGRARPGPGIREAEVGSAAGDGRMGGGWEQEGEAEGARGRGCGMRLEGGLDSAVVRR